LDDEENTTPSRTGEIQMAQPTIDLSYDLVSSADFAAFCAEQERLSAEMRSLRQQAEGERLAEELFWQWAANNAAYACYCHDYTCFVSQGKPLPPDRACLYQ
jgi:hypothetical protein